MTATALAQQVGGTDSMRSWRLAELIRAGYGPMNALVLGGRSDVDLHLARRLLAQGCPPETAVRILL